MAATGLPTLVPITTLLRLAAMTAYTHLMPEGAQRTARRNAFESVAADRTRARARADAGAALEHAADSAALSAQTP